MQNKSGFSFLAVLAFLCSVAYGQDVVSFRNGNTVKAKVIEIDDTSIKYKRFDNLDGPVFTVKKNDVESIKYKNGSTDHFVQVEKLANAEENAAETHPVYANQQNSPAKTYSVYAGQPNPMVQVNPLDYIMGSICSHPNASREEAFSVDYGESIISGHRITVSGKCTSGQKHGQFNMYDDNALIMKTKFVRNAEVKTDCVSSPGARRLNQRACFDAYFRH